METDFLSLKDESHFATLTSPIYEHGMLEDSDGSLLDIIKDEFPYGPPENAPSFWDTEPELNEAFSYPSLDAGRPDMANSKEDFQKMLTDWQEHLGSLQASDTEDLDMTMSLRHSVPEHLPDTIFEGENCSTAVSCTNIEPSPGRSLLKPKQERLGNKSCVYGMKIGGRDARLPVMEDSNSVEDATNMLLTLTPSCAVLANNEPMQHLEEDDDCIDIETVTEQIPVLEAGDLKSLLEQFEASEAVNSSATRQRTSLLPSLLIPHQSNAITVTSSPASALAILSHQKIRDSLPQEIIDKIRASSRKKLIPLIPAMPSKRIGRGTRMQDAAATLNRNKLLKLVSGSAGDTVQLDHDYCSVLEPSPPVNFYNCDANEYSNRSNCVVKPEASTPCARSDDCKVETQQQQFEVEVQVKGEILPQQETRLSPIVDSVNSKTECWEKNAKKDSGLESGEVSDASEEVVPTLKNEHDQCEYVQTQPIKKKLNLQEYRSRREELEKQRGRQSASESLSPTPAEESLSIATLSPDTSEPKPIMHSVQVQTQETPLTEETQKRLGRCRDHANRRYRSRRSTGHGWSSSGSSCSPHWQRRVSDRRRPRAARNTRTVRSHHTVSDVSSRSPSVSRSSCSSSASVSRSRSRSRGANRRRRVCLYKRSSSCSSRRGPRMRNNTVDWKRRSCSPGSNACAASGEWQLTERERQRQVEERRVIYVGRLPEGTTKSDLRKRFEVFGPIVDISVHFREHGDNYGFVTFMYKVDAYEAVEHGNEDPTLPVYDLCFGGRRTFCKVRYSDLDAQAGGMAYKVKSVRAGLILNKQESFDRLLREAQDKLQKRGKL